MYRIHSGSQRGGVQGTPGVFLCETSGFVIFKFIYSSGKEQSYYVYFLNSYNYWSIFLVT